MAAIGPPHPPRILYLFLEYFSPAFLRIVLFLLEILLLDFLNGFKAVNMFFNDFIYYNYKIILKYGLLRKIKLNKYNK